MTKHKWLKSRRRAKRKHKETNVRQMKSRMGYSPRIRTSPEPVGVTASKKELKEQEEEIAKFKERQADGPDN